ncbi:hypothetical protein BRADI_5g11025v3 [Brachypodium distachyon]|uniref:Uncharacterized protein n=1 Tax=Brachypodium distachyon TaxID=15368 RepID=A0A0Q3I9K6_BRADI|nr:hypothetical protein BRADI_5g11025v3 [Brachypodium distachyon]
MPLQRNPSSKYTSQILHLFLYATTVRRPCKRFKILSVFVIIDQNTLLEKKSLLYLHGQQVLLQKVVQMFSLTYAETCMHRNLMHYKVAYMKISTKGKSAFRQPLDGQLASIIFGTGAVLSDIFVYGTEILSGIFQTDQIFRDIYEILSYMETRDSPKEI